MEVRAIWLRGMLGLVGRGCVTDFWIKVKVVFLHKLNLYYIWQIKLKMEAII